MNMGTAIRAVESGWKQSVTRDNGRSRDAGKSDFADTFSAMLDAGKKKAEGRKQTQNLQQTAETRTDQKTDDTGYDMVKGETAGQADTTGKKTPEKKLETEKTDSRCVQDEAAAAAAVLESMAEQTAVMAEVLPEAVIPGSGAENNGMQAVTEIEGILDHTLFQAESGAAQNTGNAEIQLAAAENADEPEVFKNPEVVYQKAAQNLRESGYGRKTEAVEDAGAEILTLGEGSAVQAKNGTDRDDPVFSDVLKDQSEQIKTMGTGKRVQTEDDTTADKVLDNRRLEELKKNSDGKGVTFMDKINASRQGTFRGVPVVDNTASDIRTPVAEQLKAGVEQGMKRELTEFTIKLKPEGLGEIIVHMASAGGRTSVSIGVSNPETEKLVNSQMMSLKEMLQPLHAEVEEVFHNSQGGMDFAGFGQELYQNQGQQARGHYRHGVNQGLAAGDGVFAQEPERMAAESLACRLYAYV